MDLRITNLRKSLVILHHNTLDSTILRDIISECQQHRNNLSDEDKKDLVKICRKLLHFLARGKHSMKIQLLTATALCVVMWASIQKNFANDVILLCLSNCYMNSINISLDQSRQEQLLINCKETFKMCLCHGLLQNSLESILNDNTPDIYEAIFLVLIDLCTKHSKLTFVAFKALVMWLRRINEPNLSYCLDCIKAKAIFCIINNNWESPFGGVRRENIRILEYLVQCAERNQLLIFFKVSYLLQTVLRDQSWKLKNKYFLLAALLPKFGVVQALHDYPKLAVGLVSSVNHPHLVSAGCDAYKVCLKQLHQESEWRETFLVSFIEILSNYTDSSVPKENMLNYWVPPTLKKFPVLLEELLQILSSKLENFESPVLLSVISLVNFGRKEGFIIDLWSGDWLKSEPRRWCVALLYSALQHSSEIIRNHAFSAVCACSKTTVFPTLQEFETIKEFLNQNVNADSPPLRQGILASFKTFLGRLQDAFFREVKMSGRTCANVQRKLNETFHLDQTNAFAFLDWLYHFLVFNLEPGTNYQRKITSLSIYKEVLTYLGASRNITGKDKQHSKMRNAKDWNFKGYAIKRGRWQFDSDISYKFILVCVMDPTDDIREMAGSILIEHFRLDYQVHGEEMEMLMVKAMHLCCSALFYENESGALLIKVISHFMQMNSDIESSNMKVEQLVSQVACKCNFKQGKFDNIPLSHVHSTLTRVSQSTNNFGKLLIKLSSSKYGEKDRNDLKCASSNSSSASSRQKDEEDLRQEQLLASCSKTSSPWRNKCSKKNWKYIPGTYEDLILMDSNDMEVINSSPAVRNVRRYNEASEYYSTYSEFQYPSIFKNQSLLLNQGKASIVDEDDCAFPVNSSKCNYYMTKPQSDILPSNDIGYPHKMMSPLPTTIVGLLVIQAQYQWSTLCQDIYRAASLGSPLHGLLTALTHLVSSENKLNRLMTSEELHNVVYLMKDVVEHLLGVLSSKSTNIAVFAPSFAEMSEAIEDVIHWSAPESTLDDQDEHISPAHQLVLNCIWLNLKACCTLSSVLAQAADTSANTAEHCVQLIVQVLTRCRHKGAIESAGVALASFVRSATSHSEKRLKVKCLPEQLLLRFLDMFEDGSIISMSNTRRSAGLAILIHRIVTSDILPEKPLLHICMGKLLTAASHESAAPADAEAAQCDLPEVQALHFLCTLMKDSGLRQSMATYISNITILCFSKFASSMWAIRNAALQLFGALVPKLVGVKKVHDDEVEAHGNITIEEFISHYPELVKLVLTSLHSTVAQSSLQHSQLMPMLSLLGKLCSGGFSLMEDSLKRDVDRLKSYFSILISSDIYAVRKLSAKAYTRCYSHDELKLLVSEIKAMILSNSRLKENTFHGYMLTLKYCKERIMNYDNDVSYSWIEMSKDLKYLHSVPYIHEVSWLTKALVVEVSGIGLVHTLEKHCTTLLGLLRRVLFTLKVESSQKKLSPGIFHWAKVEINMIFEKCPQDCLYEAWLCVFNSNWDEICVCCLHIIEQKLLQKENIDRKTKSSIFHILLATTVGMKWGRSVDLLFNIFNTLLMLVLGNHISDTTDFVTLQFILYQNVTVSENGSQCASVALPLVCALYSINVDENEPNETHLVFIEELVSLIVQRSTSEQNDESCRLHAARAFSFIFPTFFKLHQNGISPLYTVTEQIIDAGLAFLQDEVSDVRKEAAKFLAKLSIYGHVHVMCELMNPYVCLEKLLNPSFLRKILSIDNILVYLCKKLINIENSTKVVWKLYTANEINVKSTSPFDHGTSNIYAEEVVIANTIATNLLLEIKNADASLKIYLEHLINELCPTEVVKDVLSICTSSDLDGIPSSLKDALHLIERKYLYISKVKSALCVRQSSFN